MKKLAKQLLENKSKTVPILSFPATQLLGVSITDLISSPEIQATAMQTITSRCSVGASLNMMDLSVEAECFGAPIRFSEDDVPTVEKPILSESKDAEKLPLPTIGSGRTSIYIEGIRLAKRRITSIPVLCGTIGPYSLAGRLMDMATLMYECYDSPDETHALLEKTTAFIISYILALKEAGADGVIMAEPVAGLLSPTLAEEFSTPYVKKIIDAVSDENFLFVYHNCGGAVPSMADQIASLGADIYHFGNAISLKDILPKMPSDSIVMGNLDPLLFKEGTVEDINLGLQKIYDECSGFSNFMLSTGCDVPATAKWENIDAYFKKINELYA
ncbi:MAG: uroporphyrinogen decarboxylase family protein [Clostridia bacterium]|nr:uroporphyrinogen decarboxylase family protein [Clostridia bacterium]